MLALLNYLILICTSGFFLGLSVSSFQEKEYRACAITSVFFVANSLVWLGFINAAPSFAALNIFAVSAAGLFCLVSFLKFFPDPPDKRDIADAEQYDERDTMFARDNIQHYPELMDRYYKHHPENRSTDRQIHQKPGFGEKEQIYHDPYTAPCYLSAFKYLKRSIPLSCGETAEQKINIDPVELSRTIIDFAKFYGAGDVGFLKASSHHFYSYKGRHGKNWGETTDQTWKTAIVIVIPMRVAMVKKGPTSCMLQESAQKYVEAAKISSILAEYIRHFGYRARAHNDANYDTLCVPIAVEAGLGELGRMGIFMHKTFGPCVRLAVVTTELELPDSVSPKPFYMEQFCKICRKCADNCPSGSITHGQEPFSRNFRHWSIHQEKCYSYWKTIGSDCGICIAVCPYTKPDTFIHRFVRLYISRNIINQKIALFMDDLLYGRNKKIAKTNPEKIFTQA